MKKWHYHVISNTHWDREWRYPFQVYRMELVKMMDRLLNILENRPGYKAFFLDSQTVILEDYLEIRPENESRIREQVRLGRLQIGPWYTLPDEWGCPGEAIVRNLLMGHRTGKRYGPISKIGYTPFSNGQISQIPQIYQGFGIDSCFFYRGVGKHVAPPEFVWEGSDGSKLLSFKFGDYARYNYYYMIFRPGLLGRFHDVREFEWQTSEQAYHVANDVFQDRQYSWMDEKLEVHEENLPRALKECHENTVEDTASSHLLYMMGHDHSFAASEEVDLIDAAQKFLDPEEAEIFHSSFARYLEDFRNEVDEKDLPVLKGEMRHTNKLGLWTNLMAEILSARLYLKQQNAHVNAKIMYGSEPLAAMAWIRDIEYPAPFFEVAWKKILINQAHDAVGGCSIDPVHEEMQARWSEVEGLSDEICRNSMVEIARGINGSFISDQDIQLTVFNTLPHKRSTISELIIDIPTESERVDFTIEDSSGNMIDHQVLYEETYEPTIEGEYDLSMPFRVKRCRTSVKLDNLPGTGYKALIVKPFKTSNRSDTDIVKDSDKLENEFLKVTVHPNGTFRMEDKQTGRIMDGLGLLEDAAEFGDPWNHEVPENHELLYSDDVKAEVKPLIRGHLNGSLKISYEFHVPAERDGDKRSEEMTAIPVELTLSLKSGEPWLDVECNLVNNAKDHRLRILFPTGLKDAEKSFAGGRFNVLERDISLPSQEEGWVEPPYPTKPFWNFCGASDGKNGVTVYNQGLIEYEVKDTPERPVTITLIRAFGKFVFGRPAPGAQCPGHQSYRFRIHPHKGTWSDAGSLKKSLEYVSPVQALLSAPTRGKKPGEHSMLNISPDECVFSGIKQGEDGHSLIVRFWNSSTQNQKATINLGFEADKIQEVTMEEIPLRDISLSENRKAFNIEISPLKIMTVAIHF